MHSTIQSPIPNRSIAGQWLSEFISNEPLISHPVVLALPRGGVPVAYEIAKSLHAPLDLILVRKLGVPQFPELAMGAIASGDIEFLNQTVIQSYSIQQPEIEKVKAFETQELKRRETLYKGNKPPVVLNNKNIILVDDGLATGATMFAAIKAVKSQNPSSITVAVPVAPADTLKQISQQVDKVICLLQPNDLGSIGQYYSDFSQVSDAEVKAQLNQAW
ncbi:phosphoribosyltransferase [Thiomicrorhabdus sp. Kp2]|uniref:phosphoribosyltransferase n=1 Tax=Thiomicrorhabdus sp. Kp2 TaxID=1123518 RepID=UPI0004105758|nr:phosphoribosyltransferase [Thiomicrorhabdus sp. Kp2]